MSIVATVSAPTIKSLNIAWVFVFERGENLVQNGIWHLVFRSEIALES